MIHDRVIIRVFTTAVPFGLDLLTTFRNSFQFARSMRIICNVQNNVQHTVQNKHADWWSFETLLFCAISLH